MLFPKVTQTQTQHLALTTARWWGKKRRGDPSKNRYLEYIKKEGCYSFVAATPGCLSEGIGPVYWDGTQLYVKMSGRSIEEICEKIWGVGVKLRVYVGARDIIVVFDQKAIVAKVGTELWLNSPNREKMIAIVPKIIEHLGKYSRGISGLAADAEADTALAGNDGITFDADAIFMVAHRLGRVLRYSSLEGDDLQGAVLWTVKDQEKAKIAADIYRVSYSQYRRDGSITPDATTLAYFAVSEGRRVLWLDDDEPSKAAMGMTIATTGVGAMVGHLAICPVTVEVRPDEKERETSIRPPVPMPSTFSIDDIFN